VRFVVDAQLPPDLARFLREQGHEARHVREIGLRNADDRDIWDYALRERAAVVTKDEDFAQRVLASRRPGPAVVWLRVGNCSNRALRAWFGPLLPRIMEAVHTGERLVEVI
jgi:predicted nuclease of predicted toxin-antitoxin system